MEKISHIVFDHDGTLVDTTVAPRRLYKGVLELLEFLKSQSMPMYVWTSRGRISLMSSLEEFKIKSYFDDFATPDEASQKPSPAGLEYLLADVDPAKVAVIGDSLGDMIGASQFGAQGLAALWAHGSKEAIESLKSYGAKECFMTTDELKQFLASNI